MKLGSHDDNDLGKMGGPTLAEGVEANIELDGI